MREIKFRGKTPDGRWVYGDLLHAEHNFKKGIDIVTDTWEQVTVIPETVGQFTGIRDMDGREIYEGDTIDVANGPAYIAFLPQQGGFVIVYKNHDRPLYGGSGHIRFEMSVTGTIHDKKE